MDTEEWYEIGNKEANLAERKSYFEFGLQMEDSYHPWAWLGIGHISLEQEEWDAAVDAFNKALECDPEFASAWFYLGKAWNEIYIDNINEEDLESGNVIDLYKRNEKVLDAAIYY
ncbi:MAG TPA: tetratricopeptide repeat protein [Candidatus Lokiarchaeia archaeon]|nr:tetratricopeptide repeat protein [Candidatus Lokiarchaeia archaeon]